MSYPDSLSLLSHFQTRQALEQTMKETIETLNAQHGQVLSDLRCGYEERIAQGLRQQEEMRRQQDEMRESFTGMQEEMRKGLEMTKEQHAQAETELTEVMKAQLNELNAQHEMARNETESRLTHEAQLRKEEHLNLIRERERMISAQTQENLALREQVT